MICKNCNRENNDNANFCAFCGKELDKKDRSKIDLKKDEDVVYFDPYDDEEVDFEDYDYEEDEEEVQNFEFKQDDEKDNNNVDYSNKKGIIFISAILLILLVVFIIPKLGILKGDSEVSSTSSVSEEKAETKAVEEDTKGKLEDKDSKNEDLSKDNSIVSNKKSKETQKIYITNSECSSILHDSTNKDYGSTRVLDGDFSTVWSEGVSGYGEGEWIRLDFDSIYTVEKIKIVNGLVNKKNGYYNNNRPKSISLRFSDGSRQTIYLEDDNTGYQVVNIDPVDSNYIEFTINSVYYGTKYDDTCIADIEVLGY
ncbi:MAG: discoidin domain-containing protein [Intestinibacter sp.]|uniref:NADase-type glycan-binding domain-containing protein n=1 Tax=Intestinibacter sp. TaxID=1965304 RepID=UPI0025BE54A8|nr:discoidin domain-containing protein [Intestinibacter sp.]MCI6737252.1 discoidin domain-containing protein [Intestinibacter sp.]